MSRRYFYATCLSFGTDGEADYVEIDTKISYIVHAGRPETPPAYAHGGMPAEGPEIDDIRVEEIDGKALVTGDAITRGAILAEFECGRHDADLLAHAAEVDWADADRAQEDRAKDSTQ